MTQKDSHYFSLISHGKEIKKSMNDKVQEAMHRQLDRITQEIYVHYEDVVNL